MGAGQVPVRGVGGGGGGGGGVEPHAATSRNKEIGKLPGRAQPVPPINSDVYLSRTPFHWWEHDGVIQAAMRASPELPVR